MMDEVTKICAEYKIPNGLIPMADYGSMNGKKVLNFALELIKN
jgi:cellobiose-specific phosphotransferase system component IIB